MAAAGAPDARALGAAPAGTLLMLGAAMSWAIGTVLTKSYRWTIPTALLTGWQIALGAVPIAVGALLRLAATGDANLLSRLGALSSTTLLATAYASLVGVIFCHWAWFRLVTILPAVVAAIGTLGIPIVGLYTSALLLGERVGVAEVVALVLVVGGLGILVGGMTRGAPESPSGSRTVPTVGRTPR
jgi:drug/metabolite transporter (DMT)-like permease